MEYIERYNYKIKDTEITGSINDLYNTYVSTMLTPGYYTYNDTSAYDDGSRSFTITGTNPSLIFSCSAEGSIGITDNTLLEKSSGYSYGRMYYSGREPDYQVITRFNNDDQYFSYLYSSWDDKTFIALVQFYTRGYSYYYRTLIVFDLVTRKFTTAYMQNNSNFTTYYPFLFGIKVYDRIANGWAPSSLSSSDFITLFSNTSIKDFNIIETIYITPIFINGNESVQPLLTRNFITNNKKYEIDKSNYTNFNQYKFGITKTNIFKFNIFVEGRINIDQHIKIINTQSIDTILYETVKNNEPLYITNKVSIYEIRSIDNKYYKKINSNNYIDMIPGEIIGSISSSNCNAPNVKLYILCYREYDNFLIGKYDVVNNTYEIPNLDTNSFYNIILVDESRTFEWIVSSHRKPKPYTAIGDIIVEDKVAEIQTFILSQDLYNKNILQWTVTSNNVDYYKLYTSENIIDANTNIDFTSYSIINGGLSYEIPTDNIHAYYMIFAVYKGQQSEKKYIQLNKTITSIKLVGQYSE